MSAGDSGDLGTEAQLRAQDPSEELVFGHCRRLYFPLWSYLNPLCHDGPELCDVLVAFGDHILVISVKRVEFDPDAADPAVAAERWRRRAIEKSVRQALGAKHYLLKQGRYEVRARGLTSPVVIEDVASKRIHCISVSLGSKGWIPFDPAPAGEKPGDLVHIFTEESLDILLNELSTIDDFTSYLREKEDFLTRTQALLLHSELDLLALYIRGNRKLPDWSDQRLAVLDEGHWEALVKQPEYQERLRRDQVSELWDLTIADLIKHQVGNTYIAGTGKETMEPLLRHLASENRFSRRFLSKAVFGVLQDSTKRARMTMSLDGNLYVFMRVGRDEPQERVAAELAARCTVAIGMMQGQSKVLRAVGLATQPIDGNPMRYHVAMMRWYPAWTPELQSEMEQLQAMGIFKSPKLARAYESEYPEDDGTARGAGAR